MARPGKQARSNCLNFPSAEARAAACTKGRSDWLAAAQAHAEENRADPAALAAREKAAAKPITRPQKDYVPFVAAEREAKAAERAQEKTAEREAKAEAARAERRAELIQLEGSGFLYEGDDDEWHEGEVWLFMC